MCIESDHSAKTTGPLVVGMSLKDKQDHCEIDHFIISTSIAQIELGLSLSKSQSLYPMSDFLKFGDLMIHKGIREFGHKSNSGTVFRFVRSDKLVRSDVKSAESYRHVLTE